MREKLTIHKCGWVFNIAELDDDVNLLMSEKDLIELENESGEEAGNKRGFSCVRAHDQNVVQSTANH